MLNVRPTAGGRYGACIAALICAVLLWVPWEPGDEVMRAAVTLALLGLAARALRLGVQVTPSVVRYRGYLWTRSVPRAQMRDISSFPSLIWAGRSGRDRRTPMPCFMHSSRAGEAINRQHRRQIEVLRQALHLPPRDRR